MEPDLASPRANRRAGPTAVTVPPPHSADLDAFSRSQREQGLQGALLFLNARTPHRYTGIFRLDGEIMRNVALVDKWDSNLTHGDDVPLADAYCAHLQRTGEPLEVAGGPGDPRVPWMAGSKIPSYCGAAIIAPDGSPWGALCHFDLSRCESKQSDMPLLVAAAALIYESASGRA